MEVGEVPKGIRWSAEAGGPPKVRIVSGRGRGPTSFFAKTLVFPNTNKKWIFFIIKKVYFMGAMEGMNE